MKRILLAFAALWFGFEAGAADLPVKAPPIQRLPIFYGGSGFYCGMGTGGDVQRVSVSGAAIQPSGGAYAAGGLLSADCGYAMALSPDRWVAIQATASYANTGADMVCPAGSACAITNRLGGDVKVKYGAPLSVLSSIFSNAAAGFPVLPGVPAGAINTTAHPYIGAGVRFDQGDATVNSVTAQKTRVRGLLSLGIIYQGNSNTTWDTFVDWSPKSGAFLLTPGAVADVGSTYRVGVAMNYGFGN